MADEPGELAVVVASVLTLLGAAVVEIERQLQQARPPHARRAMLPLPSGNHINHRVRERDEGFMVLYMGVNPAMFDLLLVP